MRTRKSFFGIDKLRHEAFFLWTISFFLLVASWCINVSVVDAGEKKIKVNKGDVLTGEYGIQESDDQLVVENEGTIKGTKYHGISAGSDAKVINSGAIEGSATASTEAGVSFSGIRVEGEGDIKNNADGTITAADQGITMNTGTVNNYGVIGGTKSLSNEIMTESKHGIVIKNDLDNSSSQSAVVSNKVDDKGNAGQITGKQYGINVTAGKADVTNEKGAAIKGGESGIYHKGAGTINNSGTITGETYHGIVMDGDSAVFNNKSGGTVTGKTNGAYVNAGTLNNEKGASITGDTAGVISAAGTVNNSGNVTGQKTGAGITGAGAMNNTGTIEGKEFDGVEVNTSGETATLKNTVDDKGNAGQITGKQYGINVIAGKADITNEAGAKITGGESGIYHKGAGTINNSGTITGETYHGIVMDGDSAVFNNESGGTVTGKTNGAYVNAGTLNNEKGASITGDTAGVISAAGTVNNSGMIIGKTSGIRTTGGTVINKADGKIKGLTGVSSEGNYKDKIVNYGTIEGTGGIAISTGAGDDTVSLHAGSTVKGHVRTGDGTGDYILLDDEGKIAGEIAEAENIEKTGSGTWTVDGKITNIKRLSVTGTLRTESTYVHQKDALLIIPVGDTGITGKISAKTASIEDDSTVGVRLTRAQDSRYKNYFVEGTYTIVETDDGRNGDFTRIVRLKDDNNYVTSWLIPSLTYTTNNANVRLRHLSFDRSKGGSGEGSYAGTREDSGKVVTVSQTSVQSYPALSMKEYQRAVAHHLDDIYDSAKNNHDRATVLDNVMGTMNPETLYGSEQYLSAIDQISGITHAASTATTPVRQSSFYQNLFGRVSGFRFQSMRFNERETDPLVRLAMSGTSLSDAGPFFPVRNGQKLPYGIWLKGYYVTGDRHGSDISSRYDYTIGGAIAGADYLFASGLRVGIALGYSKTNIDMREVSDTATEDSFQGAIYGSYAPKSKRWYVDAALSYSQNKYEAERHITFGNLSRVARASYDGSEMSGYLESGYRIPYAVADFSITPLVSVLVMRNTTDGFTETGAGALNLAVGSRDTDSMQGGLGIKTSREFKTSGGLSLTPEISAKWLHEFGDTEAIINARFADAPAGSYVMTSDTVDRDSAVISINLTGKKSERFSFFFGYDLGLRKDQTSHGFTGGVRYSW